MEQREVEISSTTFLHIRKRLFVSLEGSVFSPGWKFRKERTPYDFRIFLGPFQIRLYWDFYTPKRVRPETREDLVPAEYGLPENPQVGEWHVLGGILSETGDARKIAARAKGFCDRMSANLSALGYQEIGLPQFVPASKDELVALRMVVRYIGPEAKEYHQWPWELPYEVIKQIMDPRILAHCKNVWSYGEFDETFEEFLEGKQLTKKKYPARPKRANNEKLSAV